eukprot:Gb_25962 [translate_table: standard]
MGSIVGPLMAIDHAFHGMSLMMSLYVKVEIPIEADTCDPHMYSSSLLWWMMYAEIATVYERVVGVGPLREFEEPGVDLTFDLTQRWPSYIGPEPGGIDGHRVTGKMSQQTNGDLEDEDRIQLLRYEIDAEDIVPPRDSVSS